MQALSFKLKLGATSMADICILLVTAMYIAVEMRWNIGLVAAIGDVNISRDALNQLVEEGRFLAAFGLTWALARPLLTAASHLTMRIVNGVLFAALVAFTYAAIGQAYDAALHMIPAKESSMMYSLSVHRAAAIRGQGDDEFIFAAQDPLALVAWPMLLANPDAMQKVTVGYARAREQAVTTPRDRLMVEYPKIAALRQQLPAMREQAKNAGRNFEEGYAAFISTSKKVDGGLSQISGRILDGRIQDFTAATCGMVPNSTATRQQFAQELMHSCKTDFKALGKWFADGQKGSEESIRDTVVYDADGIKLVLGEIIDLDEVGLKAFIDAKAAAVVNDRLPTAENIKASEKNVDVIAALILPAIAILLSLGSVLLNVGGLVFGFVHRVLQPVGAVVVAVAIYLMPVQPVFEDPVFSAIETNLKAKQNIVFDVMFKMLTIERKVV
jgi:hypothetical protein